MAKPIVYFLCTGNSCRSQMAEGYARKYGEGRIIVYSAGIEQHGLNPLAVKAMAEDGIDISKQTSDLIDEEILKHSEYIVTLCGDANDKCPVPPPGVHKEHWNLNDPAKAAGNDQEIMDVFRKVRNEVKARVEDFLNRIEGNDK